MARFTLQFHALEDEILAWVQHWARSGLFLLAEQASPFRATEVPSEYIEARMADSSVRTILLSVERPRVTGSQLGLRDANPGMLELAIGRKTRRGLEESSLGTLDATPKWRECGKQVKRSTTAGVVVVSKVVDQVGWDRNHRYTMGARKLYQSGVLILSSAPAVTYRLEPRPP